MKRYLSPLELEVLNRAARGETAHETAQRLGRSYETIKAVRARLLQKLGVRNMPHAVYTYFVAQGNPRPPA